MANRYRGWSSQELERMLMLDRKDSIVDEELKEEFDRRCMATLDEVLNEICSMHPNVVYPRSKRKEKPPG